MPSRILVGLAGAESECERLKGRAGTGAEVNPASASILEMSSVRRVAYTPRMLELGLEVFWSARQNPGGRAGKSEWVTGQDCVGS